MIRHGRDVAARNPVTSIAVIKCSFRVFKKAHTFCQHFLCANRVDSAWKPFPRNVESRAKISIFEKVYAINGINLIFSLCYTLARGDTMLKSGSELLRRGYDVSIGKVGSREVDFIAANAEEKRYIQVTESMNEPVTRERELAPLRMIRDNYEKIVIAGNCDHPITEDGIKIIRLTDFLLDT